MKNLKKIQRSELSKILGSGSDPCSFIVSHDGSKGQICGCDAHCQSFKCDVTGKCL